MYDKIHYKKKKTKKKKKDPGVSWLPAYTLLPGLQGLGLIFSTVRFSHLFVDYL